MNLEPDLYFKAIPLGKDDEQAIRNFFSIMREPIMGRPLYVTPVEAASYRRFFSDVQNSPLAKAYYENLLYHYEWVIEEAPLQRGMVRLLTRFIDVILRYNGQALNGAPLSDPLVQPFSQPLTESEAGSIASFYARVRQRFLELDPHPTQVSNNYWFNFLRNIKENLPALIHFQSFLYRDGFLGKEWMGDHYVHSQTTVFIEAVLACLADEVLWPQVQRNSTLDMIDRHLAGETAPAADYSIKRQDEPDSFFTTKPVSPEDRKASKHEQLAVLNQQIAEKVKRRNELMWEINPDTYVPPEDGWVCFHCGEHFPTEETARAHFGATPNSIAGCVLTKRENGILGELRALEAKYDALRKKVEDGKS